MKNLKISASLWSADLSNLGRSIDEVNVFVDSYHFDIMDNHYVPGFLFSAPIIKALRIGTNKPFEAHLMCMKPESLLEELIDAGIDIFMVHLNTCSSLKTFIEMVKENEKKVGIVLNVNESVEQIKSYISVLDVILLMGTELGVKGVNFDVKTYEKIIELSELCSYFHVDLQIDGGIRKYTVPKMIESGANVITAGSLLFGNDYGEVRKWYLGL